MTQQDRGKNIFQSAIDAVSNRDEKAAIEAAAKRAAELEQQIAATQQQLTDTQQKLAAAEQRASQTAQQLTEAQAKITQLTNDLATTQKDLETTKANQLNATNNWIIAQQRLEATNNELQKYVSAEQAKQIADAAAAAAKAQIIAEHAIAADETLSHLALKYYGSAYEPYWRVIYEANKDVIGPNPSHIHPGTVLKIPVLPEELKKK